MATLLNGRVVADSLLDNLKQEVAGLSRAPKLVVMMVGNNAASQVYVAHKQKACAKVGIESEKIMLPAETSQEELLAHIARLNADETVHGMIVQLPLPGHMNANEVIKAIDPYKDVDGFHAYNMGKALIGKDFEDLAPCTPKGIIKILEHYSIDPAGMNAVVIGRSNIVGKPIAAMLLNRNATVSVCHSRTKDVAAYTQRADLIVVAVGQPGFLTADMVKEGAVVIDVGMNRLDDGRLVGDADFEALEPKVSAITPVPKGVGPMTVACLLMNTVTAAKKYAKL